TPRPPSSRPFPYATLFRSVLARWQARAAEKGRARTEQSFLVPKADIVAQDYDLSLNRYKEIVHDEVEHRAPLDIIADIEQLEDRSEEHTSELQSRENLVCR